MYVLKDWMKRLEVCIINYVNMIKQCEEVMINVLNVVRFAVAIIYPFINI